MSHNCRSAQLLAFQLITKVLYYANFNCISLPALGCCCVAVVLPMKGEPRLDERIVVFEAAEAFASLLYFSSRTKSLEADFSVLELPKRLLIKSLLLLLDFAALVRLLASDWPPRPAKRSSSSSFSTLLVTRLEIPKSSLFIEIL